MSSTNNNTSTSPPRLHLPSVRSVAQSIPYIHEISHCPTKHVISFIHTTSPARINVYYKTGTIGTCHVLNSEVREVFRRKCSIEILTQIFHDPPQLTAIDESVISDEGDAHEKNLELVEVGIALLQAEKEALESYYENTTDGKRRRDGGHSRVKKRGESEEVAIPSSSYGDTWGRSFAYSLRGDTILDVESFLDCFSEIRCVATNGQGTIVLYDTGGWAFTDGVSNALVSKLKGRQRHSMPVPSYVAVGSMNRFYLCFEDGCFEYYGCDDMFAVMSQLETDIASIAFGEKWDTFFVVYEDGSWECNGDIPAGLSDKLDAREERADLTCVSLGPSGEWFLKANNGRTWWGGLSDDLKSDIKSFADRITFMDFGEDDSYIVRYRD